MRETDLADELFGQPGGTALPAGVRVATARQGGVTITRVEIAREGLARPRGRYVTLECGDIHLLDDLEADRVRCALSVEIREMAERMTATRVKSGFSVLVAGLGNRELTSDAVGPETVRRLSVTRHLKRYDGALFSTLGLCEISALTPGVLGQTGLETVELVKGAVRSVAPDLVVAVDALAARSTDRLASTFQLSDTGIQPGSGIGNHRAALNRETVGVPVMALGVPTVVESSTLIYDALEKAGMDTHEPSLRRLLENGRGFFVSPKEVDLLIPSISVLLAGALEKAFSVEI